MGGSLERLDRVTLISPSGDRVQETQGYFRRLTRNPGKQVFVPSEDAPPWEQPYMEVVGSEEDDVLIAGRVVDVSEAGSTHMGKARAYRVRT